MQRGKIFVLQYCNPQADILTGYSRTLGVDVCIERQQVRPLLYSKTVEGYIVIESQKDRNYLILLIQENTTYRLFLKIQTRS